MGIPFPEDGCPFLTVVRPFPRDGIYPVSKGRVPFFRRAAAPVSEGRATLSRGTDRPFTRTGSPFPMDGYPIFEGRGVPPVPRHGDRRPCDDRLFSTDGCPDAEDRVHFPRGPDALSRVTGTASSEGQVPPFRRTGIYTPFQMDGYPSNECRLYPPFPRCG